MKYVITVCDNFVGKTWVDYFVSSINKHEIVLDKVNFKAKMFPSKESADKWVEFLKKETSKEKSKYKVIDNPECFQTLRSLWEGGYFFEVKIYEGI